METRTRGLWLTLLTLTLLSWSTQGVATMDAPEAISGSPSVGGYSAAEAFRLGEIMYREGLLPSGEPLMATVQGDILVEGTMFTCVSCHLVSGLGSTEGRVVTPPTNGARLYQPRTWGDAWKRPGDPRRDGNPAWDALPAAVTGLDLRPAYTDASLAAAIRAGRDPAGRKFDLIMPRYLLEDRDMEIMVHYLKGLSDRHSPGVTETTISFATVIAEDADPVDRQAFLDVLTTYVRDRNADTRQQVRRAGKALFYRTEYNAPYRKIDLSVWELTGPRDTWGAQLEAYYASKPVFAVLGGISGGSWEPIHRFCEAQRLPCILPVTEQPVVAASDWYTLYFSKGLYQEGDAAARYLRGPAAIASGAPVLQVYRPGGRGELLAQGFTETYRKIGRPKPVDVVLGAGESASEAVAARLDRGNPPAVVLLWLGPEDLPDGSFFERHGADVRLVFLSWGLLGDVWARLPESARDKVYLTYPYEMPAMVERNKVFVENWLRVRAIPKRNLRVEAKAYFLGWVVSCALMDMRSEFYRDYFLDAIDMMIDQDYAIGIYPRLSFGPGQRYASKGCYVVQLGAGEPPLLERRSSWSIH